MWNLPKPGTEPVSSALAGGFSTTGPPGKIQGFILKIDEIHVDVWQKPAQYYKAIILQLEIKKKKSGSALLVMGMRALAWPPNTLFPLPCWHPSP